MKQTNTNQQRPAAPPRREVAGGNDETVLRHDFYLSAFKRMSVVSIVSMCFGIAGMISGVSLYIWRPVPQNYAVTPDGRLLAMTPLSEGVSQTVVSDFVSKTLTSSFTFDFVNYNEQLGEMKSSYTEDGYNGYVDAIQPMIAEAKENSYIFTATIVSAPVITKSAVIAGVMKYKLETVVLIEARSGQRRAVPRKWVVETVVNREPQSRYPLGIAVDRIIASPYLNIETRP